MTAKNRGDVGHFVEGIPTLGGRREGDKYGSLLYSALKTSACSWLLQPLKQPEAAHPAGNRKLALRTRRFPWHRNRNGDAHESRSAATLRGKDVPDLEAETELGWEIPDTGAKG